MICTTLLRRPYREFAVSSPMFTQEGKDSEVHTCFTPDRKIGHNTNKKWALFTVSKAIV